MRAVSAASRLATTAFCSAKDSLPNSSGVMVAGANISDFVAGTSRCFAPLACDVRWSVVTVFVPALLSAVPERKVFGAADCVLATGPIARLPCAALRASTISSTEFRIFCRRATSSFFACLAASELSSACLAIAPA